MSGRATYGGEMLPSQISAIARLFSTSVIQELARKGKSPLLGRLLSEGSISDLVSRSEPVSSLFDAAYEMLQSKHHRHEYVYKSAITHKVLLGKHSLRTAAMMTEFRAGDRKADVVILNGSSTAYEIKSERDKLDRLQEQIAAYIQVFSVVNIISGENHLDSVSKGLPEDVGILLLTDRFQISTIRDAIENRNRIVPSVLFESLRLNEARQVLELCGTSLPAVPNTEERSLLRENFLRLRPEQAHDGMVTVLRSTRSSMPVAELVRSLPKSLRAACVSTQFRRQDHSTLLRALGTPVSDAISWV